MIRLELPNIKYKKTYLDAVKEFEDKGSDNESTNHYLKIPVNTLKNEFDSFVLKKINNSKGIDIKEGYVPSTEFWIVDENEKYCGRISLRHFLNEKLERFGGHIGYDIIPSKRKNGYASKALGLCLIEAKKLGLNQVLITCDDDNPASYKTIEKNGGILVDKITQENGVLTRRYKITF